MIQFNLTRICRLSTAGLIAGAAFGAMTLATPAAAEVQFSFQDRDIARMVSLGGSCNGCELSGRNLSGATFTGAARIAAVASVVLR